MITGSRAVHLVVPAGVDDPAEPSGGNTYDRRLADGLVRLHWDVRWHPTAPEGLADLLDSLPAGSVAVLDGLLASHCPEVVVPRAGRLRLVLLLHLPRGTGAAPLAARAAEAAVVDASAAVVTTSEWCRQQVLAAYDVPAERVHRATPGVDPAPLPVGTGDAGELLVVGAVTPGKGHDTLLAAVRRLEDLPWRVRCVGPLTRDPGFADELRAAVAEAGLGSRFRLEGPLTGPALGAAYAAAGLLVLPSRGETYGMVLTEALARGVPVVAGDVGGVREAVGRPRHGQPAGLLVPPDDAAALAHALRRWLTDGALRDALRTGALDRRATLRDWSATAHEVARVLVSAAGPDQVVA